MQVLEKQKDRHFFLIMELHTLWCLINIGGGVKQKFGVYIGQKQRIGLRNEN